MRVLLDEQLPVDLAREFTGHEVSTVHAEGWDGLKNGALLAAAGDAGFHVLVTNDKNIEHQQNLKSVGVGLVVLDASSNKLQDLLPRVPGAAKAIAAVTPGEVRHVAG